MIKTVYILVSFLASICHVVVQDTSNGFIIVFMIYPINYRLRIRQCYHQKADNNYHFLYIVFSRSFSFYFDKYQNSVYELEGLETNRSSTQSSHIARKLKCIMLAFLNIVSRKITPISPNN